MSSSDEWREERLRARRQKEAEEAAAAEAAEAAQAAPPSEPAPPPRPRFSAPTRPPTTFKAPSFSRRRAAGGGAGRPFSLNMLQVSLVALAVVVLGSVLASTLRPRPANQAAAPTPTQQRSAMPSEGDGAAPIAYPAPAASPAPNPIAVGGETASGDAPAVGVNSPAAVIDRPTEEQVSAAFPDQAGPNDYQGRVLIRCAVSAAGEAGACSVISETPPGAGFGEAALTLAHKFKFKPKMVGGEAVDGGLVSIPVQFSR